VLTPAGVSLLVSMVFSRLDGAAASQSDAADSSFIAHKSPGAKWGVFTLCQPFALQLSDGPYSTFASSTMWYYADFATKEDS